MVIQQLNGSLCFLKNNIYIYICVGWTCPSYVEVIMSNKALVSIEFNGYLKKNYWIFNHKVVL